MAGQSFLVPETVLQSASDVYGEAGRAWARQLPAVLAACRERWSLAIMPPFPRLSYNYAAPATRTDGVAVVLKAGFPDDAFVREAAALRLFDGHGAVRLLDADLAAGVLLLERLVPGTPLRDLADDEQATLAAADVLHQLWHPVPAAHPFPTVADWAAGINRHRAHFGTGGPIPAALLDRAAGLFAELLSSQATPALLHGDLHHDNILRAARAPWLAIDPKGVIGEPAYDTGAFLRNPAELVAAAHPVRRLERRIALLAERLALDRARIRGWAIAQVVLAACWSAEDHGAVPPHWLTIADWLVATAR